MIVIVLFALIWFWVLFALELWSLTREGGLERLLGEEFDDLLRSILFMKMFLHLDKQLGVPDKEMHSKIEGELERKIEQLKATTTAPRALSAGRE